jgi:hypothetical protein
VQIGCSANLEPFAEKYLDGRQIEAIEDDIKNYFATIKEKLLLLWPSLKTSS